LRRFCLVLAIGIAALAWAAFAQQPARLYKIQKTARVGGAGGFDYVYADVDGRRLYIPRTGNPARRWCRTRFPFWPSGSR
jgi:hypothetical protein